MIINSTTQLLLLLMFAFTLNIWTLNTLLLIFLVLLALHIYLKNNHYFLLMKRLKWFYIVMFVIFVFNTPGQHVPNWPSWAQPTYEGLVAGLNQFVRIATILAALSLILINNNKQQLISGLFYLIKPFANFGLDVKRFSARLWLTLHYVELREEGNNNSLVAMPKHLSDSLRTIFSEDKHDDVIVELNKPEFTLFDLLAISCMLLASVYAILN
jgi:energy-coupling factor transporter transmembrane protein EcfT